MARKQIFDFRPDNTATGGNSNYTVPANKYAWVCLGGDRALASTMSLNGNPFLDLNPGGSAECAPEGWFDEGMAFTHTGGETSFVAAEYNK